MAFLLLGTRKIEERGRGYVGNAGSSYILPLLPSLTATATATKMRVLPLSYCEFLTTEEVWRHECSDRIWVPKNIFRTWMSEEDVGDIVIVLLEGGTKNVAACMYGPHSEASNVIYAPSWICEALGTSLDPFGGEDDTTADDLIIMTRYRSSMCTSVKLQPFTGQHLHVEGETPDEALSRGFEEYTCLTEGQTMSLRLTNGEMVIVTIVEAEPRPKEGRPAKPLCIRNTEVVLDLLAPLDAVADEEDKEAEEEPVPLTAVPGGSPGLQGVFSFPGLEALTPVMPPPAQPIKSLTSDERAARRALFAEAALRRFTAEPTPGEM